MRRPTGSDESSKPRRGGQVERLRRDLGRVELERGRLEREVDRLQKRNKRLEDENSRLKRDLDAARRAGCRQAAPFAKPRVRDPKKPGRRPGASYGRPARRSAPGRVDEHCDVPLPAGCPRCGGQVRATGTVTQVQEELPVPRVVVRRFQVAVGVCRACGSRVRGRHRLQSSDAVGAAGVQLGPRLVALAVILNKQLGLSFGKVETLLRQQYGVTVSRSGLVRAVARAGRRAKPTHDDLLKQLRGSPVVTPDETGWKVGGAPAWLWAAATPRTTVYLIQPGRGWPQAARLLGEDFDGVLVRDGWAPYRRFTAATHQTCLAHLLRRGRTLREDHPRSRVVADVQTALQQALRLRDEARAGRLPPAGVGEALDALADRLARRLVRPGHLPRRPTLRQTPPHRMDRAVHLPAQPRRGRRQLAAPNRPSAPLSSPARSAAATAPGKGAETQQVLASVIRTAVQRQCNPHDVITALLRSPDAAVAPDLEADAGQTEDRGHREGPAP